MLSLYDIASFMTASQPSLVNPTSVDSYKCENDLDSRGVIPGMCVYDIDFCIYNLGGS